MRPSDLPFDAEAMLAGLRGWVECESPTFDAAAVNRMMGIAARDLALLGARIETHRRAAWASATASARASRTRRATRPASWCWATWTPCTRSARCERCPGGARARSATGPASST